MIANEKTEISNVVDITVGDPPSRSNTPKPGRDARVVVEPVAVAKTQEHESEFYGEGESDTLMRGDARGGRMPDSTGNRRNPTRRPALPPYTPPENDPNSFHYPPSSPYAQRSPFYTGQYTMSHPQMGPHYPYSHGYQHPDMLQHQQQNIHAGYQAMMTPSMYPSYPQNQSSEGASSSGFSNPSIYAQQTSPPSAQQSSSPQNLYPNSGQFHSLRYPSPMSSQYPYNTPPFSPSSMYTSQYTPAASYPRPFSSDSEAQPGGWWYMLHAAPVSHQPHQYNETPPPPSYQTPYPLNYSPVNHPELDTAYPHSPAPSASTSLYPLSSVRPSPLHVTSHPPSTVSPPRSAALDPPPTPPENPPKSDGSIPKQLSTLPSSIPVRRPYHPNPPAHRSEWVMWSGNVPSDATHDELWRFFNQPPEADDSSWLSGVLSIFLISRSSCAFINYESETTLQDAIARFNGIPLRPQDPRCPRLVCRVRKKDDDLKAGVGGQRGVGMHVKWIKDQKAKVGGTREIQPSDLSDSGSSSLLATPSRSVSSDDEGSSGRGLVPKRSSNSSGSYASTNSGVLSKYFPKRFFILKSLSQYDLDLSVEKGLWATQKHNEGILDQAYRTSAEVYLIFGVNKSGEFYGYAKMAGPVKQGEHRVSWGPRTDSSASTRSSLSPVTGRGPVHSDTIYEEPASPSRVLGEAYAKMGLGGRSTSGHSERESYSFFPNRPLVDESPQPFSSSQSPGRNFIIGDHGAPAITSPDGFAAAAGGGGGSRRSETTSATDSITSSSRQSTQPLVYEPFHSAPAELGEQHKKITLRTPPTKFSLGTQFKANTIGEDFQLDEEAPIKAIRNQSPTSPDGGLVSVKEDREEEEEEEERMTNNVGRKRNKGKEREREKETGKEGIDGKDDTWGESFKVEWICTERLPFFRTRHIRNPWNHDREIKVSRDGTELEPSVGQQLIDEWMKLVVEGPTSDPPPPPPSATTTTTGGSTTRKAGGAAATTPSKSNFSMKKNG